MSQGPEGSHFIPVVPTFRSKILSRLREIDNDIQTTLEDELSDRQYCLENVSDKIGRLIREIRSDTL